LAFLSKEPVTILSLQIQIEPTKNLPVRIIEGHAVDHVGMLVQTQQLLAGVGVPDLASTVVAACNELVSIFVKRTVRERQQVRSQNLKKREFLLLVLHLLLNQLCRTQKAIGENEITPLSTQGGSHLLSMSFLS
jgi:hypothetical protein